VLTEFELIKHCFNWPQNNDNIICAVGDDASIIQVPSGYELVQSIDTQVADVHFPASAPAQLIAQRALRCAISDLAAMGAKPQAFHLALSLPKNTSQTWLESFSSGLRACADEYAIDLIGGDTTTCPSLVITLQVQGLVPSGKALTRGQAQIGDDIWLSGEVGRSAAALEGILANPEAIFENNADLAAAYYYPQAQVALGQKLISLATSAMDISDGLLQDASHIAKASLCCLNIESKRIPLNVLAVKQLGQTHALQFALTGGDDYQLLFTAPASVRKKIETLNGYRMGTVLERQPSNQKNSIEHWVLLDGHPVENKQMGYQHF
jgi:thiamine-monophosphate kinase